MYIVHRYAQFSTITCTSCFPFVKGKYFFCASPSFLSRLFSEAEQPCWPSAAGCSQRQPAGGCRGFAFDVAVAVAVAAAAGEWRTAASAVQASLD